MSLADSWQQVFAGAHARPDTWCVGCGYWPVVNGRCRDDCTARHADSRNSFRSRPTPRRANNHTLVIIGANTYATGMSKIDLSAVPMPKWTARKSALTRWKYPADSPEMRVAEAGLRYWRLRRFADEMAAIDELVASAEGREPYTLIEKFVDEHYRYVDDLPADAGEDAGDDPAHGTSGVAEDAPEAVGAEAAVERPAAAAAGVVSAAALR